MHVSTREQTEPRATCSKVLKDSNILIPVHVLFSKSNKKSPVCNWYAKKTTDEETWCLCSQPEEGDMIACHNENCVIECFHFQCVGIKKKPSAKTKWYCPDCKPEFQRKWAKQT